MTPAATVALLAAVAFVVALAILTAIGERRRGGRLAVVLLAGVFFPVAWIAWYRRDAMHAPEPSS